MKKKYRYVAWLPVDATTEYAFELESDAPLSGQALLNAFMAHAQPTHSGLCHECALKVDLETTVADVTSVSLEDITVDITSR